MRANVISLSVLGLGILMTLISIYAYQHRSTRGSGMFALFMASITLYVVGYGFELSSLDLRTMLFWSKIEYIGTNSFPNLFLMFVLVYTGRKKWLTPRNISLLFIIPAIVLVAKFTENSHHLIYAHAWVTNSWIPLLGFTPGPVYALSAYSGIPVVLGIYLLVKYRKNTPLIYRQQATVIALSVIPPLLIFVSYILGYRPFPELRYFDTNALLYPVWAVGIGWAVFRFRLFDLAPIAREALIEHLSDGVLVLDANARLVDANPTAVRLMGWDIAPVGQDAGAIFAHWPDLQAACTTPEAAETVKMSIEQILSRGTLFFDLSITALQDKAKKVIGRLIVIHDITDLKQMEKKLQDLALIDELTGLHNRRGFLVLAAQFMEMVKRMNLNAAVIFIDLDN
ncbi:MAG: histidine kinase N-terminal 7TM domain-containing protein, partial [Anaerolineaceae bacterium]